MKELLRTNDPVLLSFISALLEEGGIAFMVADLNMSVLEGSIGILPRRVLVETDRIAQARNLLTEAGIGHVIADDKKI
jgi:glycerol dehydrogenase-like iron-containing ADH family enzyme